MVCSSTNLPDQQEVGWLVVDKQTIFDESLK